MRSVVFLICFFAASRSFGEIHFNSKVRNFSMELLYQAVQDSDGDIIISPYAIWYLLISMAYETKGVTREQLMKVLLLTEDRREVVAECMKQRTLVANNNLRFGTEFWNYLYYDEHLNVYLDSIKRLENDFDFKTRTLDFKKPRHVKNLLSQSSSFILRTEDFIDSPVLMGNSFTFIKYWSKPFETSNVVRSYYPWYGNKTLPVDTMYMKAPLRFSNLESLHASVTELPYRGDTHYMLLVRPHHGYDVHQVFTELRRVPLADILVKLQIDADELGLREIEVKLPEYTREARFILNKPLINMGLSDAFDPNFANFENFVDESIYIGEIGQRVTINFTPHYTTVATVTPGLMFLTPEKIIPVQDPFIFFIMEKSTATILFGGSVSKTLIYVG